MGNSVTPEQLDALVRFAAARLHMSPQELTRTVQTQGLDALASRLSPQDAAKVQGMRTDQAQAAALLQSPQVQALLRQLGSEGNHE